MKKYKFFEPHITGGDARIVITETQIIKYMKNIYADRNQEYPGDENAVLDFIAVNWATELKED